MTDATINVRIVGKDEITPAINNITRSIGGIQKSINNIYSGNFVKIFQEFQTASKNVSELGKTVDNLGVSFKGLESSIGSVGNSLKNFISASPIGQFANSISQAFSNLKNSIMSSPIGGFIESLGAKFGGVFSGINSGISSVIGSLGGLGGAIAGVLGIVGGLATAFIAKTTLDLMNFAKEAERYVNQVKHTMENFGVGDRFAEQMKTIAKFESESRFESEELNRSFISLFTSTKDVSKANELLGLSMDIASKKGLNLYQVATTLTRVALGQATSMSLSSLGIELDNEKIEKMDNQQQKIRYIFEELHKTFDGSYRLDRETGAGALENIEKQIDNIKQKLGMALLEGFKPLFEQIGMVFSEILQSEGFSNFVTQVSELASSLGDAVIQAGDLALEIMGFENLGQFLDGVSKAFEGLAKFIGDIKTEVENLISLLRSLQNAYQNIKTHFGGIGNSGIATQEWGGFGFTDNTRHLDQFGNPIIAKDALITKDGKIIHFDPNDNILAFQKFGGGITTNMDGKSNEIQDKNNKLLDESNEKLYYFNMFIETLSNKFRNLTGYIGFGSTTVSPTTEGTTQTSRARFDGSSCNSGTTGITISSGRNEATYILPKGVQPSQMRNIGDTWDESYQRARNAGMSVADAIQFAGGRIPQKDERSLRELYEEGLMQSFANDDGSVTMFNHRQAMDYAYENLNKTVGYTYGSTHPYLTEITGLGTDETEMLRNKFLKKELTKEYANDAYIRQQAGLQTQNAWDRLRDEVRSSSDSSITNLAYLFAGEESSSYETWKPPTFSPRWKICNECGTKNPPNVTRCKNPNCYYHNYDNRNRWTYEEKPTDWDNYSYHHKFNDVLITKKGDFVEFHPDDDIIATKDGLKNKQDINLTFNVYESSNPRELVQMIMKEINRVVRIG